jgi:hypothetical protein
MKGLAMRDSTKAGPILTKARPRAAKAVTRFKPGDLITAEALNGIIDAVNALADRVAALEKRCG